MFEWLLINNANYNQNFFTATIIDPLNCKASIFFENQFCFIAISKVSKKWMIR